LPATGVSRAAVVSSPSEGPICQNHGHFSIEHYDFAEAKTDSLFDQLNQLNICRRTHATFDKISPLTGRTKEPTTATNQYGALQLPRAFLESETKASVIFVLYLPA
jgi:hypothetical protein